MPWDSVGFRAVRHVPTGTQPEALDGMAGAPPQLTSWLVKGDGMPEGGATAASKVAVDIGGTFTDIALVTADGCCTRARCPPRRTIRAARWSTAWPSCWTSWPRSGRRRARCCTAPPSAPTPSCSASGARTGLITTRGFRDVLEIGRIRMPDMFDLTWDKPKPLVPRRHRLEVAERIAADGSVVEPLDEASVIAAGEQLVGRGHRGGRHLPSSTATATPRTSSGRGDPARAISRSCW